MQTSHAIGSLFTAALACSVPHHAVAEPPLWEFDQGGALRALDDSDESERTVVDIPFAFPFAGRSYDAITVYVGGIIALGGDPELDCCPEPKDIISARVSLLAPLWSDLETESGGAVRANILDGGTRAVITWDGVRSDAEEDTPYTFQVQLHADGRVIFGWDGTIALGDDALDSDLIVGLGGNGASSMSVDYAFDLPFTTRATTIYEFWEENEFDFPLDDKNVVFTPAASQGWVVSESVSKGPSADFDGDGDVDTDDLLILLAGWGSPEADLSGDADTGFEDLSILLAAFD